MVKTFLADVDRNSWPLHETIKSIVLGFINEIQGSTSFKQRVWGQIELCVYQSVGGTGASHSMNVGAVAMRKDLRGWLDATASDLENGLVVDRRVADQLQSLSDQLKAIPRKRKR